MKKPIKLAMLVDRARFQAWCEGILLVRDSEGNCLVGDDIAHEKAQLLLEEGKAIGLTSNGQLVSMMYFNKDAYIEVPVENKK